MMRVWPRNASAANFQSILNTCTIECGMCRMGKVHDKKEQL